MWLKNTSGKKDAMLTVAITFAGAAFLRFLFGGVVIPGADVALQPLTTIDTVTMLGALAAYIVRRGQGGPPAPPVAP